MRWQEEQFVCVNCFEEPGLIRFIKEKAVSKECSLCESTASTPIAALIDEVSGHFLECLFTEYELAVEELGWVGSEGGWGGTHWDADELLFHELELEFPQDNRDQLLPLLFGEHGEQDWCEKNPYGLNDEELARFSWSQFRRVIMHGRRFFFQDYGSDPYEHDLYSPREVLRTIFEYAERVNLFMPLPQGVQLYRARYEGCKPQFQTPAELGPPPEEAATQSNRMSPAGIPMFYGADDEETALKETYSCPGYYAMGRFETLRPAVLLDLTVIPPVPSLFESIPDSSEDSPRRVLKFLHHVAEQVSISTKRDGKEHVEYVPTQVVTEFVRDQLTWDNSRVEGIKYFSSAHEGHVSYVLFADQSNVLSTPASRFSDDQWLKLIDVGHRRVNDARPCA